MTTGQIIMEIAFYLAAFVAVAYFTRAKLRRIRGALAGGAVFGLVALLALALGEAQGWWRVPSAGSSHFHLLLWLDFTISSVLTYLILWRVVRRFGGRGLAVCVLASAIIGPPRDYWITAMFPAWMTFAPGIAPVLADATIYALLVVVGHAVMLMVVGPRRGTRWPSGSTMRERAALPATHLKQWASPAHGKTRFRLAASAHYALWTVLRSAQYALRTVLRSAVLVRMASTPTPVGASQ